MAYSVAQRVISKKDSIYDYCDDLSRKSKLLYNASLFRIRNIFTGYEKEHLTSNEAEVFGEVKLLHESYPGIHVQKVICYKHLEKLMRVTENPDFFAGLPNVPMMQLKSSVSERIAALLPFASIT